MSNESSSFQVTNQITQVSNIDFNPQRSHRVTGSINNGFDDLDLAFIELLGSWKGSVTPKNNRAEAKSPVKTDIKEKETLTNTSSTTTENDTKRVMDPQSIDAAQDPRRVVQEELAILIQDMSPTDIQFMKEGIIPGLPIISGAVPIDTLFSKDPQGNISCKGFDISQKLAKLIEEGYKTGRAFRVEVDDNSSVILKIRHGKVSADFISSDRAAAFFIKQELDELKQRLQAKNLPVDHLGYRETSEFEQQRRNNQPDDDENLV